MLKMQRLLAGLLFIFCCCAIDAQKPSGNNYVSKMMYLIPDKMTETTQGIADYINENFTSQKDKSRAIYVWIARNIQYNFDSIITNSIYETPADVSARILKSRNGVCLNFASLFNEIANKTGIRSYMVQGYTRQQGRIDYLPHVWCAALIDTAWYLFDPTWGSGYYSKGRFVNEVNSVYFMAKPKHMIRSHIPFDPMWQLLHYPAAHRDFARRTYREDTTRNNFNFNDTIAAWEIASALQKAEGAARRIEQGGVTNAFIEAKLRVLKGEAEYLSNKRSVENYDSAVNRYNQGIHSLNRFIIQRNAQFTDDDTTKLSRILDSAFFYLQSALMLINSSQSSQQNINISLLQLNNAIQGTIMAVNDQRAFLNGYIRKRQRM